MSDQNRRALAAAVDAARAAGALLRRAFHRGQQGEVDGKSSADEAAEALIRERLTAAFPQCGFRAEEQPAANTSERVAGAGFWLVDPNDGTSAFQKGFRGASVSIALIRERQPVLGVVFAYAAPDDRGDLFTWAEGCGPLRRNGEPILNPEWPTTLTPDSTVLVSNSADVRPLVNASAVHPARYQPVPGIAYRLALTAAGDGVAATSLFSPRDFDYAAGHALLRGVGGVLLDEMGRSISYNPDRPSRAGFCFGGQPDVCAGLVQFDWKPVLAAPRVEREPYDLLSPRPGALTADPDRLGRAHGCWLGQLVGDALGSQVEFLSPDQIDARWPSGVNALLDGGTHSTIAGQMTDDSELARLLAHTLLERDGYDPDAAATAYGWWLRSQPFDIGNTIGRAARAVDPSAPAASMRAAANRGSQANGALMRCSPLAIAGHRWSERRLVDAVRTDAALTHPHPICQDANAAFALAVAFALREGSGPEAVYSHAVAGAKALGLHADVIGVLEAAGHGPPADYLTHQGWVRIALHNAFFQLLFAEDLAAGLMDTIARGGDTDTNACIAGALLGATHGREALPWLWRDRVLTCRPIAGLPGVKRPRPRAFWPVDALVIAERLLAIG